ncbi:MMPL family transporter [Yinghuangia sp. YIM S09857]|uniref:MMPL family transporter n=1 Tax=Yinghuangia sp. YIM S09857 TaxID=3436929 RepID=UPI003F530DE2
MFAAIGRLVVRRAWWVVAVWVVAGTLVAVFSPGLKTTTDQADFLPGSYQSVQAQRLQNSAFPGHHGGAVAVFQRADGTALTDADHATVARISSDLTAARIPGVASVTPGPTSPDRLVQVAQVVIPSAGNPGAESSKDAIRGLRTALADATRGTGLTAGVAGPSATSVDEDEADEDAARTVAFATVAIILALLLLVFRSPVAALLPVVVIGGVYPVVRGLIASVDAAFDLTTGTITTELLTVVLFGVGTDYTVFLLFRYREALRSGADPDTAVRHAVTRVGEAIASAAGVVIVAFAALTLSSLGLLRSLGPALALAVLVMLLAGLTLIPAIVSLLGTAVFWPSRAWRHRPAGGGAFVRLGDAVARRPARWAAGSALLMALLALGSLGYKPDFDLAGMATPSDAPSQVATRDLEKGFPPGVLAPTEVYLTATGAAVPTPAQLAAYGEALRVPGVVAVEKPRMSTDGRTAEFTVVQADVPSSAAAMSVLRDELRPAARESAPPGTKALVGGATAVSVDTSSAVDHDYAVVFPVAAACILLILGLLLRSLVAPWLLMLSVALGFGATLGASTIVFRQLADQAGLVFVLPIVMYLFVVALGTDYNILMVSRLREESRAGRAPREATAGAVAASGPAIASAGMILTGTFATLLLGGNVTLVQLGFTLAFGIAVTAFVMALLFTPSLTALVGRRVWWPGRGGQAMSHNRR